MAVTDVQAGVLRSAGFDEWAHAVDQAFVPLAASTARPREFSGSLASAPLGRAAISVVGGSAITVSRTRRTIAAADRGVVKFGMQLRGSGLVRQDDREATLRPGDLVVYDTTRPYDLRFDGEFRMLVVMFTPGDALLSRQALRAMTARTVAGVAGVGALTAALLRALAPQVQRGAAPLDAGVDDAALSLIASTLHGAQPARSALPDRREALMASATEYIDQHLGEDLPVQRIADATFVSVRLLQKLFEEHGSTCSAWVRQRRLERCRIDLADATLAAVPVAQLGARWGFSDPANFARAFRGAFGSAPSAYRRERLERAA